MNLAYVHSRGSEEGKEVARAYAEGALAVAPDWHYVRDILLVQIDRSPSGPLMPRAAGPGFARTRPHLENAPHGDVGLRSLLVGAGPGLCHLLRDLGCASAPGHARRRGQHRAQRPARGSSPCVLPAASSRATAAVGFYGLASPPWRWPSSPRPPGWSRPACTAGTAPAPHRPPAPNIQVWQGILEWPRPPGPGGRRPRLARRRGARAAQERAQRAEALRARAELQLLRSQLNPHFVLNTLHALLGPGVARPAAGEAAIERLGELLRFGMSVDQRARPSGASARSGPS